jgi:threonine dehydrogenase-like Zn-dependent dehydrogenase
MDVASRTFELALRLGCDRCTVSNEDAVIEVQSFTRGYGADAVLLTAATASSQPVELAIHPQARHSRGRRHRRDAYSSFSVL